MASSRRIIASVQYLVFGSIISREVFSTMGPSLLADAHRLCDHTSYARNRYTQCSAPFFSVFRPRSVTLSHRGQSWRHAKRPCSPALAASSTQASPDSRIQTEKQIAQDLVRTDLPYTTHSWQWRGHKVNYAVRPTQIPLYETCSSSCNKTLQMKLACCRPAPSLRVLVDTNTPVN